jgi:hypothetical protein
MYLDNKQIKTNFNFNLLVKLKSEIKKCYLLKFDWNLENE